LRPEISIHPPWYTSINRPAESKEQESAADPRERGNFSRKLQRMLDNGHAGEEEIREEEQEEGRYLGKRSAIYGHPSTSRIIGGEGCRCTVVLCPRGCSRAALRHAEFCGPLWPFPIRVASPLNSHPPVSRHSSFSFSSWLLFWQRCWNSSRSFARKYQKSSLSLSSFSRCQTRAGKLPVLYHSALPPLNLVLAKCVSIFAGWMEILDRAAERAIKQFPAACDSIYRTVTARVENPIAIKWSTTEIRVRTKHVIMSISDLLGRMYV